MIGDRIDQTVTWKTRRRRETPGRQAHPAADRDERRRSLLTAIQQQKVGASCKSSSPAAGRIFQPSFPSISVKVVQWKVDSLLLPLEDWTHVAVVKTAEGLRLYRNGALASSEPLNGFQAQPHNPLSIGGIPKESGGKKRNRQRSGFWHGRIDELAFFGSALTGEQIENLFATHPIQFKPGKNLNRNHETSTRTESTGPPESTDPQFNRNVLPSSWRKRNRTSSSFSPMIRAMPMSATTRTPRQKSVHRISMPSRIRPSSVLRATPVDTCVRRLVQDS